jgi:hypothetical protein
MVRILEAYRRTLCTIISDVAASARPNGHRVETVDLRTDVLALRVEPYLSHAVFGRAWCGIQAVDSHDLQSSVWRCRHSEDVTAPTSYTERPSVEWPMLSAPEETSRSALLGAWHCITTSLRISSYTHRAVMTNNHHLVCLIHDRLPGIVAVS